MSTANKPTATPAAAQKEESFNDSILPKYKVAGEISAKAIKAVIAAASEGKSILELCNIGDKVLSDETAAVFKGKSIAKGIAFPTTLSLNNVVCNYSPLPTDEDQPTLKKGDVVKVQLGAYIDGLPAICAETFVVGADSSNPATGRAADAIKAALTAADIAIRVMKPGVLNTEVSKEIEAAIKEFGCKAVEGMQSNQFARNEIDSKKKIVLNAEPGSRPDTIKLEEDEIYGVDISVTTSADGKTRSDDSKTTIYRKTNNTYLLKLQTSRKVLSEIKDKAASFPFNLKSLEDVRRARIGVQECAKHGLLTPFHVLEDSDRKAITAQVFFTVAVNAKGAIRITPAPTWATEENVKADNKVENEKIKHLLSQAVRQTKKKNKPAAAAASSA
ncbi:related to curved dna-binding protein [Melanopsichium pennsylvanicum]|uniref:Related to curved dna-binding protein n=2 Tax=Melanopsichium pennsylvanicum TaxID=63383 RepID=A0AAJ5C7R9_9BASI|nr:related to curved dna-binding protein [Melanopsichium pennsylvanicum 4]SNX86848.1 related to curved dna-binding protein [Melanopsichium pennsylvanicum]